MRRNNKYLTAYTKKNDLKTGYSKENLSKVRVRTI